MAMGGHIWSNKVLYGHEWSCMVVYGEPLRMGKTGRFTRANPAKNVHFARANQAKNVHFARVGKPSQKCSFYPHAQLSDGDELTSVTIRTHIFWGGRTNMCYNTHAQFFFEEGLFLHIPIDVWVEASENLIFRF